MARRINEHDIDSIIGKIRQKLISKMNNEQLDSLELLDKEDTIILDIRTKKTVIEKQKLLHDLEGSGLQHDKEVIDDAIGVANREEEGDREETDIG